MVSLRDAAKELEALEVHILAISADDVATQKSFCVAQSLNFTLLSDPDGSVARKYGSWRPENALAQRDTIVVDSQGKVRYIWRGVKELKRHGQDLVSLIRKLRQGEASP